MFPVHNSAGLAREMPFEVTVAGTVGSVSIYQTGSQIEPVAIADAKNAIQELLLIIYQVIFVFLK